MRLRVWRDGRFGFGVTRHFRFQKGLDISKLWVRSWSMGFDGSKYSLNFCLLPILKCFL